MKLLVVVMTCLLFFMYIVYGVQQKEETCKEPAYIGFDKPLTLKQQRQVNAAKLRCSFQYDACTRAVNYDGRAICAVEL